MNNVSILSLKNKFDMKQTIIVSISGLVYMSIPVGTE